MTFRKTIAAALALAMGCTLAAPAFATAGTQDRLTKVTAAVKRTLDIGDEYTEFYGEPSGSTLGTRWSLNWSGDAQDLYVSATEEGKVLNYSRNTNQPSESSSTFGPSFPATSMEDARQIAQGFVAKVFTEGEKAAFDAARESGQDLNNTRYGFRGTVELNGLSTPMSFRVWVDAGSGQVTNFWRGDESDYAGKVPPAQTSTTSDAARALLRDTLEMELLYVREEESDKAVLRYIPQSTDEFYVDAATGELVNVTELRKQLDRDGGTASGSSNSVADMGGVEAPSASLEEEAADKLSDVELEGIAKLEGVLPQETLDAKVRAWKALMLDGFKLSACSYAVERTGKDTPKADTPTAVSATLAYTKKEDNAVARRQVTVDARTGALQSMSGYNPYDESPAKLTESAATTAAEDFLKALWGEEYALTQCYASDAAEMASGAFSFTFAHKVNGYFFPENAIRVRISARDGAVMGFSKSFDRDVTFDSADGLISPDDAKTAWADTYPVKLAYLAIPTDLKLLADVEPLLDAGWSYYYTLKPGYNLGDRENWYSGVDAKTGKPVEERQEETQRVSYDDLNGHWAQTALEELAAYNVGWYGGKANPDGSLTQLDYLALLASVDGYRYIPGESDPDQLYTHATRRGLLDSKARKDDQLLTRGDMVRMMLDAMGYKDVAGLKGIFHCGFSDAASISEDMLGYAALAQGLGLIKGGSAGEFAGARTATRGEAAVMLWQYMKR